MDIDDKISQFTHELSTYIGQDYLVANGITIDEKTRFYQLNFDMVDEIITELIINDVFVINDFRLDQWPVTIGELLLVVRTHLAATMV